MNCLRLNYCVPCRPPQKKLELKSTGNEVEIVAVTLFNEGSLTEAELDKILATDRDIREEVGSADG
jgi:hypothetical protein